MLGPMWSPVVKVGISRGSLPTVFICFPQLVNKAFLSENNCYFRISLSLSLPLSLSLSLSLSLRLVCGAHHSHFHFVFAFLCLRRVVLPVAVVVLFIFIIRLVVLPVAVVVVLFSFYLFSFFLFLLFFPDNMHPSGTLHSLSLARCTANRFRKRHLSEIHHNHVCVAVCIIHFVFETEGINECEIERL